MVALSSTTSTAMPAEVRRDEGRLARSTRWPRRSTIVKWNVLPLPTSLSTQIRPPISSTSRVEMASPRPVPPYRRVVEPSAWAKASKMRCCLSCGMPMPVSDTVKRTADCSALAGLQLDPHHDLARGR